MAGMGRAMLAGVQGFNQGYDRGLALQDRDRQIAAEEQAAQWATEDRAGVVADRAQARELRGMQMEDAQMSRLQRRLLRRLGQVATTRNPAELDALYKEIPDGFELAAPTEVLPDGRLRINHQLGTLEGSWEEALFGTPDNPGLYYMINPDALLGDMQAQRASAAEAAAAQAEFDRKLQLEREKGSSRERAAGVAASSRIRAAEIAASRPQAGVAPRVVQDANGNFVVVDPNTAQGLPVQVGGQPLQGRQPSVGGGGIAMPTIGNLEAIRQGIVEEEYGKPMAQRLSPAQIEAEAQRRLSQSWQAVNSLRQAGPGAGVGAGVGAMPPPQSAPPADQDAPMEFERGRVYEDSVSGVMMRYTGANPANPDDPANWQPVQRGGR